eukprot:768810-Hanusia_phi.AAC.20
MTLGMEGPQAPRNSLLGSHICHERHGNLIVAGLHFVDYIQRPCLPLVPGAEHTALARTAPGLQRMLTLLVFPVTYFMAASSSSC